MLFNNFFYSVKPVIPRRFQIFLRRRISKYKRRKYHHIWPIDSTSGHLPKNWTGWPDNKRFALVLSHDVDTQVGHDRAIDLLNIEKSLGFRSSFNFVPERYNLSKNIINHIKNEGFEVGIHGLKHDGKLFKNKKIFLERASKINRYIDDWEIDYFTAPSMICNSNWLHNLNISHSTTSFDTDPFEPQSNPINSIFPILQNNLQSNNKFVELPYTLPQDHSLFIIQQEKDISIWKNKLDWIADKGGMALLNTHPDYMDLSSCKNNFEKYPVQYYIDFIEYIKTEFKGQFFHALPLEVSNFYLKSFNNTNKGNIF